MLVLLIAGLLAGAAPSPLEMARDQQDRGALVLTGPANHGTDDVEGDW